MESPSTMRQTVQFRVFPRPFSYNSKLLAGGGDDEEQAESPIKRPRKQPSLEQADEVKWTNIVFPETSGEGAKDVAEINLSVRTLASGFAQLTRSEKEDAKLRVRVQMPMEGGKVKVGALQEVSKQDLRVQVVLYPEAATTVPGDGHDVSNGDDIQTPETNQDIDNVKVLISGEVDGPDAVVTALAYLIRQGYICLKPAPCLTCGSSSCWDHDLSGRLRVLITKKAFVINSESFGNRSLWKRAMQTLICWLRPEVVSPTRARSSSQYDEEITENFERLSERTGSSGKQHVFDPSALYDAVKPSW